MGHAYIAGVHRMAMPHARGLWGSNVIQQSTAGMIACSNGTFASMCVCARPEPPAPLAHTQWQLIHLHSPSETSGSKCMHVCVCVSHVTRPAARCHTCIAGAHHVAMPHTRGPWGGDMPQPCTTEMIARTNCTLASVDQMIHTCISF